MSLTRQMRQSLIAKAHSLNPIIIIGNQGISEALLLETARALYDHELIKVRIPGGLDKESRNLLINELAEELKSEYLKRVGNILILYQQSDKKNRAVTANGNRN